MQIPYRSIRFLWNLTMHHASSLNRKRAAPREIMRTLCLSGQRSNWCNLSVAFSPLSQLCKSPRSKTFRVVQTDLRDQMQHVTWLWQDKTDKVHKAPEASSQKAAGRYASMKIMESRYMSNLLDPRHLAHHILRLLLCLSTSSARTLQPQRARHKRTSAPAAKSCGESFAGSGWFWLRPNWIRIYCADVNDLSQNGHDVGVHSWHRPIVCTIKPHFASRAHGRASIPHQFQVIHFHALSPSHINKLAQTLISMLISISSMQSKNTANYIYKYQCKVQHPSVMLHYKSTKASKHRY